MGSVGITELSLIVFQGFACLPLVGLVALHQPIHTTLLQWRLSLQNWYSYTWGSCAHTPEFLIVVLPFLRRRHLRQPQRFFPNSCSSPLETNFDTSPHYSKNTTPGGLSTQESNILSATTLHPVHFTACNTSVATIMGLSIVSASFLIQQAYHNQPGSNCFNVPTSGTTLTVPQGGHSTPLSSGG